MSTGITGLFETRRHAEMAIERMVQDYGIERTDIFVEAAEAENSAGVAANGADTESGHPGVEKDGDPALNGSIRVAVELEDDAIATKVREAFAEFAASDIAEG